MYVGRLIFLRTYINLIILTRIEARFEQFEEWFMRWTGSTYTGKISSTYEYIHILNTRNKKGYFGTIRFYLKQMFSIVCEFFDDL
jgi:hypothetical protein